MIARNLRNADPATLCEKSLIAFGQELVSGAVGNHQDFQQSKSRRNQLFAAFIDFSEKRLQQRKKAGMFFDEVDEDRGIYAHRAAADIGPQSHEARSRSICADASIPFQCSLPNPWRSRIDRGFGVSRASLRIWVTSCAIDRCWCFARA